MLVVNKSI